MRLWWRNRGRAALVIDRSSCIALLTCEDGWCAQRNTNALARLRGELMDRVVRHEAKLPPFFSTARGCRAYLGGYTGSVGLSDDLHHVGTYMQFRKSPQRNVLDFALDRVSQATIYRAYMRWRVERGLPTRCDNETCPLHNSALLTWNGKPLKLILDHIDGQRKNNRPGNLRLMCPNCDSQLPTRGGGNKGRIRNTTSDSYQVVERNGIHEVKVMITGVSATACAGGLRMV